jgi:hypothetical protein
MVFAPQARADDVVAAIADSGGRYVTAGASLAGSDCSGLVSVAQSLAMGEAPHRLGDTRTLLAGGWPGAIPGATPDDLFVIGVNWGHMAARVNGVGIESTTPGAPYRIGDAAASPWASQFIAQYHIDPGLLVALA